MQLPSLRVVVGSDHRLNAVSKRRQLVSVWRGLDPCSLDGGLLWSSLGDRDTLRRGARHVLILRLCASAGASAGASLRRGHPGGSMHLGLDLWGKPHRKLCGRRRRLGFRLRLPLWRQGLLLRLHGGFLLALLRRFLRGSLLLLFILFRLFLLLWLLPFHGEVHRQARRPGTRRSRLPASTPEVHPETFVASSCFGLPWHGEAAATRHEVLELFQASTDNVVPLLVFLGLLDEIQELLGYQGLQVQLEALHEHLDLHHVIRSGLARAAGHHPSKKRCECVAVLLLLFVCRFGKLCKGFSIFQTQVRRGQFTPQFLLPAAFHLQPFL
mmetsp:Transcript_49995/g.119356  ORF Transcript_49995/g.119356 Transcript_49995/m.119356 type:complete len:326 (-) Transcript_49995:161-1138(-)